MNDYFAPQRETSRNYVLTSNFAIVPEMRLTMVRAFYLTRIHSNCSSDGSVHKLSRGRVRAQSAVALRPLEPSHRREAGPNRHRECAPLQSLVAVLKRVICSGEVDYSVPRARSHAWLLERSPIPGSANVRADCRCAALSVLEFHRLVTRVGAITVADVVSMEIHNKGGYYTDSWIKLTLPRYFA